LRILAPSLEAQIFIFGEKQDKMTKWILDASSDGSRNITSLL
jgi:hypothetical protein